MGMRTCLVGALVLTAACEGQTGILIEVSMSNALHERLDPDARDFDTLRIYVGHPTPEDAQFTSDDDAFLSIPATEETLVAGFRYLLEPDQAPAAVGPLMLAAAAGLDGDRPRFAIVGFAAAPTPTTFAAGEVRVIALALRPDAGAQSGADDECVRWSEAQIAPPDDRDCDGAIGVADCDDRDPSRNQLDVDRDGQTSCAGDCMEFSDGPLPWVDPAEVYLGSRFEADSATCTHVDYDCDGFCGDPSLDRDGNGTTGCGAVVPGEHTCAVTPADCDENRDGNNPAAINPGEACNAEDDGCDGFLPPPLPCFFRDDNRKCHTGTARCDELEGEYAGERENTLACEPGGGHSGPVTADGACAITPDPACLEDADPIACATQDLQVPRVDCTVTARSGPGGACRPDRRPLARPIGTSPQCQWFVVGGTRQAEWEIGFVEANAALDAAPTPTSSQCAPSLAVRASVPGPAPRTVLLLVSGGLANGVLQPVLVKLHAGDDEPCTGVLACTGSEAVVPPPL